MSRYSSTRTTLLKDNSWIKRPEEEDEAVDRDPNFGRTVLSRYKSDETLDSTKDGGTATTTKTTSSVQALTKRFSSGLDDQKSSTLPSSYTRSSYSSIKSDPPTSSTTTTTVSKDGKTTETTITTTQTVRSSPKTETFSERVKSSSKGYTSYSPTRTTKVTETTVTSNKNAEDKLYDTLVLSPIKDDNTSTDKKTVYTTETVTVTSSNGIDVEDKLYDTLIPGSIKNDETESKTTVYTTETVTVKSSNDGDDGKTITRRSTSKAEDDLYDTLLPKAITSPVREETPSLTPTSSTHTITSYSSYTDDSPSTRTSSYTIHSEPSDNYSSKTYSYSRPDSSYEYTSITSPSSYTSPYRSSSITDDTQSVYSRSSIKSTYASPERTVLEKDLCNLCHKPFTADAKMILDDLNIRCHASCFRCEVCNSTLGHLRAGDSMWVYKRMVHCENCFEVTRDKWRR